MPFQSKAQARFMYSQHPDIAARWQKEAPAKVGSLPARVTSGPSKAVKSALSGKEK